MAGLLCRSSRRAKREVTADLTVPEWATHEMVDVLRDGGVTLDCVLVPDAGHVDVAFGYLAYPQARTEDALMWLRTQLARWRSSGSRPR